MFRKNDHLDLLAYTRADWAGDRDDRKSAYGYFTLLGGNLVTWESKKQKGGCFIKCGGRFSWYCQRNTKIKWIQKILSELHFPQKKAYKLFCDNKATISISGNPVQYDRTKHVEINRHFIKEKLEKKIINIPFVRSKDQLEDIHTKAVTLEAFKHTFYNLGFCDPKT